jgi:tetratricopeptide (TPR) repeat protein
MPEIQAAPRGLRAIVHAANARLSKQVDRSRILLHVSQVVDLQTNGKNAQAAEDLERAIEAGLEEPAAFFDLGLLYVQSEKMESAQPVLQRAVKHPDFALGAHLLLGQVLRKGGRLKEASLEYLESLRYADAAVVPDEYAEDLRQLYEPILEGQSQQTDAGAQERLCINVVDLLMRPGWRGTWPMPASSYPYRPTAAAGSLAEDPDSGQQ